MRISQLVVRHVPRSQALVVLAVIACIAVATLVALWVALAAAGELRPDLPELAPFRWIELLPGLA